MGNQSAVLKFKNEFEKDFGLDKSKLSPYNCEVSSEILTSSNPSKSHHSPLYISMRRKAHIFDRTNEKPKEFYDEINYSIPTLFRWTGEVKKSITVSGSFNDWKINISLSKCDDDSYYVIINCTPGTHLYKFFIDGNWCHDPNQPVIKNIYGTYDNVVEVKEADTSSIDEFFYDDNWGSSFYQSPSISNPDMRKNFTKEENTVIVRQSPPGDYSQTVPRRTISDYDILPMQFPSYLNDSILDTATQSSQEPSLLPHPHHVQLNHMYASSIKDGLICLSATIRYRSKFITLILYKTIPV